MPSSYQARRISKPRAVVVRNHSGRECIVLSGFNGMIIIEPKGARVGDGQVLSAEEAKYELQPVWCRDSKSKIDEARRRLGLDD